MKRILVVGMLSLMAAVGLSQKTRPGAAPIDVSRVQPSLPVVKTLGLETAFQLTGTPANPTGGKEVTAFFELSAPAPCVPSPCRTGMNGLPTGGMLVKLSSSNTALATVPQQTQVPFGKTHHTFAIASKAVTAPSSVVISAWREGSPAQTATLTLDPPMLKSVRISSPRVIGGHNLDGRANFSGPAATSGSIVTKLSVKPTQSAQVPATTPLPVNATVAPFTIKTFGVASDTAVTLTATHGTRTETTTFTVSPAVLSALDRGVAKLNGVAAPAGAVLSLRSANPQFVSVPPDMTIPAGSDSGSVPITKHSDFSDHEVTISATYNGVTKSEKIFVMRLKKPDLAIQDIVLKDRFGNVMTNPPDSQPFKMCFAVVILDTGYGSLINPDPVVVRIAYQTPTGTGTSTTRDFDRPVPSFVYPGGGYYTRQSMCEESLPGVEIGKPMDVTLTVDPANTVDEPNDGNNTATRRISR